MNILFHTYGKVCATAGGTERATVSVAKSLTHDHDCRCFSLYEVENNSQKEDCFVDEFHFKVTNDWNINISHLRTILEKNKIDVLIVQGSFIYVKHFVQAASVFNCRVILAHHFRPGAEELFYTFKQHLKSWKECTSVRRKLSWLKNTLIYPHYHKLCVKSLKSSYREAYYDADNVVILCKGFIDSFQKYANFKDNKKFTVIPNALSFDEFLLPSDICKKEKVVLIVARMDETYKRISLALNIWKLLKQKYDCEEWKLHIVGEGPSLNFYKELVNSQKIHDVHFFGRQNPIPHYKESSIFLMTSISESWGLTLTEAQQFGVVPIAFNTYESLSEIICNTNNGIVIKEGDIAGYVDSLYRLIADEGMRRIMARNAIESSKKFSQKIIVEKWWHLLTEIIKNYD